ncbi:MAG: type II secretion system F family protein [Candidatus Eremiobacteraeota bacterium]|nr:type II secretion system F family protein [Candidatus Eremiobacteraeota bacterium]
MRDSQLLMSLAHQLRMGATLPETLKTLDHPGAAEAGRGQALHQALAKGGSPEWVVRAVEQVEQTDNLPAGLERLSETLAQGEEVSESVRTSLLYPRLVLVVAVLIAAFLIRVIGGQLWPLLEGFSLQLPAPTMLLLFLYRALANPIFVLLGVAVLGGAWLVLSESEMGDGLRHRLPLVGEWFRRRDTIIFLSWLDFFLAAGLALPEACRRAAEPCRSARFRQNLQELSASLGQGASLSRALENNPLPVEGTAWLVGLAEEKGFPEGSLARVARFFRHDFEQATARGLTLIEPLALIGLGMTVTLLVLGMFLPLYQLVGNLG